MPLSENGGDDSMGWNVHLLVTFPYDGPQGVVELAKRHLPPFAFHSAQTSTEHIVGQFLEYLAAGKGIDCATKGGRFAWGVVGNNTDSRQFVELLRPFWVELLGHFSPPPPLDWDGPLYYESVLVFSEAYEVGHASLIEIRNRGDWRTRQVDLVVEQRERMPFTLSRSNEYDPTFE
jgi:hypothetical protein